MIFTFDCGFVLTQVYLALLAFSYGCMKMLVQVVHRWSREGHFLPVEGESAQAAIRYANSVYGQSLTAGLLVDGSFMR
jgi:hypothetical protein